jgi:hypothetical protein
MFRTRVVGVALPYNILQMHRSNRASDMARLRIPSHVISNGKRSLIDFLHRNQLFSRMKKRHDSISIM